MGKHEYLKDLNSKITNILWVGEQEKTLSAIFEELKNIDFIELLTSRLDEGYYFDAFMFTTLELWKELPYSEWQRYFDLVASEYHYALYSLEPFFYKYLRIDLFTYFSLLDSAFSEKAIKSMSRTHSRQPGNNDLIGSNLRQLKDYYLHYNDFMPISNNLISQGAIPINSLIYKDMYTRAKPELVMDYTQKLPEEIWIRDTMR